MLHSLIRLVLPVLAFILAAPALAPGSDSHHAPGGGFRNPHLEQSSDGPLDFMIRRLFGSDVWADYDAELDGAVPRRRPRLVADGVVSENARVTWIGQATVLLQHAGVNVLTDPMFSDVASPVPGIGPSRKSTPGLAFEELPRIDVVVISHDHFDHLDGPSIRRLGNGPRYFVPLGLKRWLMDEGIDPRRIFEMDWWESRPDPGTRLTITATPTQHVSGRALTDRNQRLWAGWAIEWPDFSVWFAGDTGYNDVHFKQIGARFDGFDLGILPIGSYAPRDYMRAVHLDPSDAVQVHQDIRAARSMAMHWGTFHLTAEPLLEPPVLLAEALRKVSLPVESVAAFSLGESRAYLPRRSCTKQTERPAGFPD